MSDSAIRRRSARALLTAVKILNKKKYSIIFSNHNPFDIIAIEKRKIRFIRICLDELKPEEKQAIKEFAPEAKTIKKEAWIRKHGQKTFEKNILSRGHV